MFMIKLIVRFLDFEVFSLVKELHKGLDICKNVCLQAVFIKRDNMIIIFIFTFYINSRFHHSKIAVL